MMSTFAEKKKINDKDKLRNQPTWLIGTTATNENEWY